MPSDQPDSHPTTPLSDEELVSRAQSGSVDSFAEIVARFDGRLFNFIARRVGRGRSRSLDAEDLTQETLLRAWRSIGEFRPTHRFSTWLFTIASRLVVDHMRHRQVRSAAQENVAHAATLRLHDQSVACITHERTDMPNLWSIAREVLNDEQHAALWLRYAEDLSPREVACVLNRSEVSVRVMLFRARQTLAPHARDMLGEDAPDGRGARISLIAGGAA